MCWGQHRTRSDPVDSTPGWLTFTEMKKQQAATLILLFWASQNFSWHHIFCDTLWPICIPLVNLSVCTTEHYLRGEQGDRGQPHTLPVFIARVNTSLEQVLSNPSETQQEPGHCTSGSLGPRHQRESGHKPGFCQQQVTWTGHVTAFILTTDWNTATIQWANFRYLAYQAGFPPLIRSFYSEKIATQVIARILFIGK